MEVSMTRFSVEYLSAKYSSAILPYSVSFPGQLGNTIALCERTLWYLMAQRLSNPTHQIQKSPNQGSDQAANTDPTQYRSPGWFAQPPARRAQEKCGAVKQPVDPIYKSMNLIRSISAPICADQRHWSGVKRCLILRTQIKDHGRFR